MTGLSSLFGSILAVDQPADPTTTYVLMGAGSVAIVYMMMRLSGRKKKDPFDTPFQTRGLAQHRSVERQMENLLVELSEMSRQMTAQLDTRAAKLEALIQDADERIARLKAMNDQAPPRPTFAEPADSTPAATMRIVAAPEPVPAPEPPPPEPIIEPPLPEPIDPAHAAVYQLADEGKNIAAIAAELNRPSGEVELILALRPRTG